MFVPNRYPTKEYWANTWLNNVGIEHYIRFIMALPYSTTKSPRLRYPVGVDNNDIALREFRPEIITVDREAIRARAKAREATFLDRYPPLAAKSCGVPDLSASASIAPPKKCGVGQFVELSRMTAGSRRRRRKQWAALGLNVRSGNGTTRGARPTESDKDMGLLRNRLIRP